MVSQDCDVYNPMRRPIPIYTKLMHKEDPPKKDRRRLISAYKKGGAKFEENVKREMGDTRLRQGPTWDPRTGEELWWHYIGSYWWCRRRKNGRYEFARIYALKYVDDVRQYDGLWNERRHAADGHPKIVYRDGKKGFIVGHNKYEIFVQWEDEFNRRSTETHHSSLSGIRFEYEEDEKYFKRLLEKENKNAKRDARFEKEDRSTK